MAITLPVRNYRGIIIDADKRVVDAATVTALCHELETLRTQLADARAGLLLFRTDRTGPAEGR